MFTIPILPIQTHLAILILLIVVLNIGCILFGGVLPDEAECYLLPADVPNEPINAAEATIAAVALFFLLEVVYYIARFVTWVINFGLIDPFK